MKQGQGQNSEISSIVEQLSEVDLQVKNYIRAKDIGLIQCHCCGLLNQVDAQAVPHEHAHCSRCKSALHSRKPESLNRTFALVVAAAILYIPANVLPKTVTDT